MLVNAKEVDMIILVIMIVINVKMIVKVYGNILMIMINNVEMRICVV